MKAEPVRKKDTSDAPLSKVDTPVEIPHKESSSMTNKPKGRLPVEEEKKMPPEPMRAGKALTNNGD